MTKWTAEAVETLKRMWRGGSSSGEIARALHVPTRNAVVGKLYRLGISGLDRPPKPKSRAAPKRIDPVHGRKDPGVLHRIMTPPKATPMPLEVADDEIPKRQRRTLLALENEHCRWPCGEPNQSDFYFCGHPSADLLHGRAYCEVHMRKAFQPRGRQ